MIPLEMDERSTAGMMGRMEQTGVANFQCSNWNWSSLLTKLGHLTVRTDVSSSRDNQMRSWN